MSFLVTTETKATGGKITILDAGSEGEIVKILMDDNLLGSYELPETPSANDTASGLRAAIESDVTRHKYNVAGSGADIELIAPEGLGSSINGAGISFYSSDASTVTIVQFSGGITSDYNQAMYAEILNIIVRSNDEIKVKAESSAVEKVAGYLSARYDTVTIFSQTGSARHPLIVELVIDIALYNMHAVGNPENIPDLRVKRYDDAAKILNNIQCLKMNPVGLPLSTNEGTQYIKYGGNAKQSLRY